MRTYKPKMKHHYIKYVCIGKLVSMFKLRQTTFATSNTKLLDYEAVLELIIYAILVLVVFETMTVLLNNTTSYLYFTLYLLLEN